MNVQKATTLEKWCARICTLQQQRRAFEHTLLLRVPFTCSHSMRVRVRVRMYLSSYETCEKCAAYVMSACTFLLFLRAHFHALVARVISVLGGVPAQHHREYLHRLGANPFHVLQHLQIACMPRLLLLFLLFILTTGGRPRRLVTVPGMWPCSPSTLVPLLCVLRITVMGVHMNAITAYALSHSSRTIRTVCCQCAAVTANHHGGTVGA